MDINEILSEICGNNTDALNFCKAYLTYGHMIDDLVDGDKTSYKHILDTVTLAQDLFTSRFYQANYIALYPAFQISCAMYKTSLDWVDSTEEWKRNECEVIKNGGHYVILAVAVILGRDVFRYEQLLREISYKEQRYAKATK